MSEAKLTKGEWHEQNVDDNKLSIGSDSKVTFALESDSNLLLSRSKNEGVAVTVTSKGGSRKERMKAFMAFHTGKAEQANQLAIRQGTRRA